ncbi:MAG: hypothetical protein AUJ52_13920 [Elusimicrobia bacterium CG1_02_63_36]|nr:MAG: hypothetical protein AUJ52_13920 [Elusimicrobia bacterium CG1_02_63_36]PIP82358.1 MAG: hypothetical protein COR54_15270 [Elusimicrobia bacterium CG22_combo_CG10-13_8_21_14_all_63_91]PJA13924.1 MAG: hypothetical protein COX66_13895 [Elusimicrobia bacterium CG_4_10_14_0_2_um_filter_63_34]PJB23823.1 MAG: hypothetical protein CO113_17060 [Elusimicrobia bacterium CG_4_9_14_3_um_filter_62_55]
MKKLFLTMFVFSPAVIAARTAGAEDDVAALVSESTSTPKLTIDDLYKGGRFRDPFRKVTAGETNVSREDKEFSMETFSIHSLKLKGVMREKGGAYAILIDEETATGFILKQKRLYTYKNEKIPGVTGKINIEQKTVTLITDDKDVQTLRLGEEETEGGADEPKD